MEWPGELTPFLVTQGTEAIGVPLRIVQRNGMSCLEQTILGDTLAAPYTAGSPTLQITDGTHWDSPHIVYPYRLVISTNYPDPVPNKNILTVTGYNAATKTLSVAYYPYSGTGFASTAQSYPAGAIVGQDTDSWTRPFTALRATENGKLVNDPAAGGAVPVRSFQPSNDYSVPFDTSPFIRHYGYYAHPDVQARHANWTPYRTVSGVQQNLTTRGPVNGAAAKFSPFDGSEFWLEFTVELESRFYLNTSLPNEDMPDGNDKWGMKWVTIDTEASVIHQVLTGHSSEDRWSLPGTNASPAVLSTNKAGSRIGYDDYARTAPNDSHQGGGAWHVAPGYARLIANPNPATSGWPTPDGKLAWEMPTDTPVAMAIRMRPGHARTNDTQIEWLKAEIASGSYGEQWTTVLNLSDVRLNYGNSSAQTPNDADTYPDGPITWPSIGLFDTLPGFQTVTLMGYSNVRQGAFPRPMRRSFRRWLSRVTLRRSAPPAPRREARPSYMPSTPNTWLRHSTGGGVLTNTWYSQVAPWYSPFYAARIGLYSSLRFNRWWGHYGAYVGVQGGHAANSDNSAIALVLNDDGATISFKRLTDPPHYFTTPGNPATYTTTNIENNAGWTGSPFVWSDQTYGEVLIGGPEGTGTQIVGMPAAPHSCDALDVIGPAHGGGRFGSLQLVARFACTYEGDNPGPLERQTFVVPHHVRFDSLTAAPGAYTWERTANVNLNSMSREGGYSSRFVPAQGRIYVQAGAKTNHGPVWFDLATKRYVQGTGAARAIAPGGVAFASVHVPDRDLLLWFYGTVGSGTGQLRVDTLPVGPSDTDPSWTQNRPLATSIPIDAGTGIHALWCPPLQKLLIGNVAGDPNCVYEVTIPANLADPWPCERVAFTPPASLPTFPWCGSEGYPTGWEWNERVGGIVYLPASNNDGNPDSVYTFRPRGV